MRIPASEKAGTGRGCCRAHSSRIVRVRLEDRRAASRRSAGRYTSRMSELFEIELPRKRPSGPARPSPEEMAAPRPRLPPWLKVRLPGGEGYSDLKRLV